MKDFIAFSALDSIAAFCALLAYRSRYGVPDVFPVLEEHPAGRVIDIQQRAGQNEWEICSVRLARRRRKWLATASGGIRNEHGEFLGYSQGSEWRKGITFARPAGSRQVVVHPDASGPLVLCFSVRLRADPSVKRRIKRVLPL